MRISAIAAHNFRTLEDFHLSFNENYCAISGKNNAGKSAIFNIIKFFFDDGENEIIFRLGQGDISFTSDATQWAKDDKIELSVQVHLDRSDDSELMYFIQKFSGSEIKNDTAIIKLGYLLNKDESSSISCSIDERDVDNKTAIEILKKFRGTSSLIIHNSTVPHKSIFYFGESYTEMVEGYVSATDRKKIVEAEKGLQTQVKKAAKQHKEELEKLLGRLNDKYHVELGIIDRARTSHLRLEVKLTDRSVEVPLSSWGAGTQNRTRILMSVLQALKIRSLVTEEYRTTPVFLVEEPESFLHPSAQAEFGQVLNDLAKEFGIQIIATTHSPYMLNQSTPSANILLERRQFRNLQRETIVKDTSGEDWMLPFADNLGIIPKEFNNWKPVFGAQATNIILVEGQIDKSYFEFFLKKYPEILYLPADVEIIPYDGKDSLKNTPILQFMLRKLNRIFITFDLDAKNEIQPYLDRIGLVENQHYCAIGLENPAGHNCIEGLLPVEIKKTVYAEKHELVTAIASNDSKSRKSAKNNLKQALLEECKNSTFNEKDLSEFRKLFSVINRSFKSKR